MLKRHENISRTVSVPRGRSFEPPTLQDALPLSMRPDRRELLCQHRRHTECRVTTKISQLPRTLILQLNRYVFRGGESRKVHTNIGIAKFLSLNEYVADDVTQSPEWKCTKTSLSSLSEVEEPERPPALSSVPAAVPPSPASVAPSTASQLVVLDDADSGWLAGSREGESHELKEAISHSLVEGEPADTTTDQAHLSEFGVEDYQSQCSVDLALYDSYRLVGVVSHYGGSTHSGHYVSDV